MTEEQELIWLAGLLEGEGCFFLHKQKKKNKIYCSARISMCSTDEDIIERVAFIWKCLFQEKTTSQPNRKQAFQTCVTNKKAELWMEKLKPFMGVRRTAKIDEVLSFCATKPPSKRPRDEQGKFLCS